jgi:hypothetical protein
LDRAVDLTCQDGTARVPLDGREPTHNWEVEGSIKPPSPPLPGAVSLRLAGTGRPAADFAGGPANSNLALVSDPVRPMAAGPKGRRWGSPKRG